jgi:galactose mutarotase-like enzyme
MSDHASLATVSAVSGDGRLAAKFVPAAGMLCCSLRLDDDELLDAGKGVEAYAERGATMGIPLLYPWANRLAGFRYEAAGRSVTLPEDTTVIPVDPNGLPIHGVVPALLPWEVDEQDDAARVSARLAWDGEALLGLYPFAHELQYEARLADQGLTITTTVRANGGDTVPVSFGYHPYLRPASSGRESWDVELPDSVRLELDDRMLPTGERQPATPTSFSLAERSLDDAFGGFSVPARYAVRTAVRAMAVELIEGYPYSQVYAPAGREFICFEPMTAPANALCSGAGLTLLAPGGVHRAVFRLLVGEAGPAS